MAGRVGKVSWNAKAGGSCSGARGPACSRAKSWLAVGSAICPGSPIAVSVIYPGYIRSEMNARVKHAPFMVGTEEGVRALVEAVEKEKPRAVVPAWPWVPLGIALRLLPLRVARRLLG